jgi:DNA-binding transcriptional LysR family regulator
MELRHLRYLVAIADAGAFVRAAERLNVAQPALTRQMHDLEEELGATLFDPAARRATLTPAGRACVRLARHIIQDTEQAVARVRLSNSGIIGRCVIATGPLPLASGMVPAFLTRMRRAFPGINLVVLELAGRDQWSAVERAEADIGLGGEPFATFASLSAATQYLDRIDSVAVAATHPLAGRESVDLSVLLDIPLLTLEAGHSVVLDRIFAALDPIMAKNGSAARLQRRQFSSIESLAAHVRAGQGWTLAPSALTSLLPGVAMVKLTGFEAVLPTVRIWRRTESRPAVLTVLEQLRQFQENRDAEPADAATASDGEPVSVPLRLELRHLRSFLAVVEHGSLGRAAEIIGITQPALSRQMRELEYDVGVSLFSRESRGMEITHAGETFRDDVGDVLSVVDKIPREIRRAEREQDQRCLIGVVPHPAIDAIVTRVLTDVEGRGERVRIGTRTIIAVHQAEALRGGEIDIALGHIFPVPNVGGPATHLITVPLVEDRLSTALLPESHPLAAKPVLYARELADIPFVTASRDLFPAFYDLLFARFAEVGLRPRVEAEYEGLSTIWSLVLRGGGWALGWKSHLLEPPRGLVAVPFADFDIPWGTAMTYRQDESRVHVLAAIDAIVDHARQIAPVKTVEAMLPPSHTQEVRIS